LLGAIEILANGRITFDGIGGGMVKLFGTALDGAHPGRDKTILQLRTGPKSLAVCARPSFGTIRRDEATDGSDVDLLVGFAKPPGFSSFMKLRIFLEDLLGTKVDLVTESGLRDRVRPYVEKEAIRVA